MSSITATVDSRRAQVRLDVDFSDVNASYIVITRTILTTGVTATLRYTGSSVGGASTALAGRLVAYDTEAPLDTPVQYTAYYPFPGSSAPTVLNSNPYFENGRLTPWTSAGGATIATTTGQFHQGAYSLQVTPDGVTASPQALSEEVAVTVGASYSLTGWLRSTLSTARAIRINWYDVSHALLSSSSISSTPSAGVWTLYGPSSFAAPANAVFARVVTIDTGTPVNTNLWQVDQITITATVSASASSAVVQVPSNGYGWLKDPVRPANSVQLDTQRPQYANRTQVTGGVAYLGLGDQVAATNMTLFNVNNSAYPVAVTRIREAPATSIKLLARTPGDVTALDTLLAAGSALLLQLPATYSESDRYAVAANVTKSPVFVDQRRPRRLMSFPLTTVQAPTGPAQGVAGVRWADLCTHTSTWGVLEAQGGGTYDDFARTVGAGAWGAPAVAPSAGATWTVTGTASDFSVGTGGGIISASAVNSPDLALIGSSADSEQYLTITMPVVATGAGIQVAVLARRADASNYYRLGLEFGTGGSSLIIITKRVAGVETVLGNVAGPAYSAGQVFHVHALVAGTSLKVSGWKDGTAEPVEYKVVVTDASLAAANPYGVYVRLNAGNTNTLPVVVVVDDYQQKGTVTWQGVLDGVLG